MIDGLAVFSDVLMYISVFVNFTASLGLLRFPDFFSRVHAVSLSDSFALPVLFISNALHFASFFFASKMMMCIMLILLNSATATYFMCKLVYSYKI